MKAIRYAAYGPPEAVVELREVDPPPVGDDDVLVRVRAAAVNPGDWHFVRGLPYVMRAVSGLRRPKFDGLGMDLAGQVEATGRNVTRLKPGDEVFGHFRGAFAEYVAVPQDKVLLEKPAGSTYEQAAAVPLAALTAYEALATRGEVKPGQKVLVVGAAGGVGTFAVQIAKALGAEVTGVCSGGKAELVASLGADEVIDYTRQDFARYPGRYDVILDNVGDRRLADYRRALAPTGAYVPNGGSGGGSLLGPTGRILRVLVTKPFVRQRLVNFVTAADRDTLAAVRGLVEAGQVVPVVSRTYRLDQVPEAIAHVEQGHATGKVVVTL
ncbi:NAD(P)-dependent alcohol dehydrogenase [Nonomuraea sp. NPDC049655]|uniref:NAD(P)-dependent alcohol dehydrogenase n=1 Tax=Nonomuraea sp. NPDC049655 TaxID=3364355 RepID=UPI0037953132